MYVLSMTNQEYNLCLSGAAHSIASMPTPHWLSLTGS